MPPVGRGHRLAAGACRQGHDERSVALRSPRRRSRRSAGDRPESGRRPLTATAWKSRGRPARPVPSALPTASLAAPQPRGPAFLGLRSQKIGQQLALAGGGECLPQLERLGRGQRPRRSPRANRWRRPRPPADNAKSKSPAARSDRRIDWTTGRPSASPRNDDRRRMDHFGPPRRVPPQQPGAHDVLGRHPAHQPLPLPGQIGRQLAELGHFVRNADTTWRSSRAECRADSSRVTSIVTDPSGSPGNVRSARSAITLGPAADRDRRD